MACDSPGGKPALSFRYYFVYVTTTHFCSMKSVRVNSLFRIYFCITVCMAWSVLICTGVCYSGCYQEQVIDGPCFRDYSRNRRSICCTHVFAWIELVLCNALFDPNFLTAGCFQHSPGLSFSVQRPTLFRSSSKYELNYIISSIFRELQCVYFTHEYFSGLNRFTITFYSAVNLSCVATLS